jgi:hypothetical protein
LEDRSCATGLLRERLLLLCAHIFISRSILLGRFGGCPGFVIFEKFVQLDVVGGKANC